MNKLAIWASSILILFILFCNQNSEALTSGHHRKRKSSQSVISQPSKTVHKYHKHYSSSLHTTKHKTRISKHVTPKPRYAYPMGLFLMEPPTFEATPLPDEISVQIKKAFYAGNASQYPTRSLVRTGIASYYPMRGGIFWRREPIKYLIMHSTEPGIPVGAKTIIDGWSHGGKRHAGAHYVIDRDGTIYQAVDPDLATVHVNIFKTLPGINNDNSIGIEMCHQGSQDYPPALVESASRLAAYLQNHYHIPDINIITHRYAQQGDHTDPVNFAWDNFIAQKDTLQNQALNQKVALLKTEIFNWQSIIEQPTIIVIDKKTPPTTTKLVTPKQEAPKIITPKQETPKITEVQAKPETKTNQKIQSPFEAKFGAIDKPVNGSSFEAKFAPINKPESTPEIKTVTVSKTKVETTIQPKQQMQTVLSTPTPSNSSYSGTPVSLPFNSSNNVSPTSSNNTNRLIPTPPITRLVPVTMIINVQPQNNAINQPTRLYSYPTTSNQTLPESKTTPTDTSKKPSRSLPLRGPIEMEPDEASLLSQ